MTCVASLASKIEGFFYISSPDELVFGPDDGLEEAEILDMLPVGFDVLDVVLNHLLAHL